MNNRRLQPRGYTLLEILLVMGVILMASTIAIINISGLPDSYRLSRVSNEIRGFLTGLRARAMEEGVSMEFSFVPDYGGYRIRRGAGTASNSSVASEAAMEDITLESSDRIEFDSDAVFGDHELPRPLVFKRVNTGANQDPFANPLNEDRESIRFFPDGSCTGIEFIIDDGTSAMHFHVRALTGGVRNRRLTAQERDQR
jgi:prepilin-type N-terminal cleavage/methylation domain-containing protein